MSQTSFRFICRSIQLAGLLVALALGSVARAEVLAADSAADPAYSDGWQGLKGAVPAETGTDNGGTGFEPWIFDDTFWEGESSPYSQPHFIDTKPSSFNALGAPAFALTNGNVAFNGYTTTAVRPFAAGLKVGDRLSLDIDNPVMQPLEEGDSVGFVIKLQTVDKAERFGLYTTLGFNDDQWTITDSRGSETSSGFSDEAGSVGFELAFQLTGEEAYKLTLTPRSGGAALSFEGSLAKPGKGEIKRLELVMYGNGSGDGGSEPTGARELYFNNLRIESSGAPSGVQKPGDCNADGSLDISDATCFLGHLFQGAPPQLPCEGGDSSPGNLALLDVNGDGGLNISDPVWILGYLFRGTAPPVLGSACQPIAGCPDNAAKCKP